MTKSTAAKARTARAGKRPLRRNALPRWAPVVGIVAAVVALGAVVWALAGRGGGTAPAASIDHVHGLGVNPADGMLYAAAHNGVFRVPGDGPAHRVGEGSQDTMGFTVADDNHFLASGHPASGDGGPRHLGLIESTDGGKTWRELSLRGAADFHALRYRHGAVYGYNSTNGQLMVSHDRQAWQTRTTMDITDFVVSPTNPDVLLATTQQGVVRSKDGGRTWTPPSGPPVVLLAWDRPEWVWGILANGDVLRSADGGAAWSPAGRTPGPATAFAAHGGQLYVSVHEQGIFRSFDGGASWRRMYS